jgi:hypothetical protein
VPPPVRTIFLFMDEAFFLADNCKLRRHDSPAMVCALRIEKFYAILIKKNATSTRRKNPHENCHS